MALKNANKTPYNYCSNNPINRTDPLGLDDGGGKSGNDNIASGTYTNGKESHTYTGKEGVTEQTLKDFGWKKQPDIHGVAPQESKSTASATGGVATGGGGSAGRAPGRAPGGGTSAPEGSMGRPSTGNGGSGAPRGGGAGNGARWFRLGGMALTYISLALTVTGDTRRPNTESEPESTPNAATEAKPQPDTEDDDDSNDKILFRAMQKDENTGMPKTGETARTLGVRPNHEGTIYKEGERKDIDVDDNNMVYPINGNGEIQGMSVAPDTPTNLPPNRKPPSFGGTGKDPVWSINKKLLPPGLIFYQDKAGHGVIAPEIPMPYEAYLELLNSTAPLWKPVGGK